MDEPVTSDGIRSGVNWMRAKRMSQTWAKDRAINVFASPGKSSIRMCPSARNPSRTSSSGSRFPTTARSSSGMICSQRSAMSPTVAIALQPLKFGDDLAERGKRRSGCEPVLRRRAVRPDDLPGRGRDELAGARRLPVELDAVTAPQPECRDLSQHRAQAHVEVELAQPRKLEIALEREPARGRRGA